MHFYKKLKGLLEKDCSSQIRKIKCENPPNSFNPMVPLPEGASEEDILQFLKSIPIFLPPWTSDVIDNYCQYHLRRFLYSLGLIKELKGRCLELGSAPYFMTILLEQFTELELVLANYFGPNHQNESIGIFYKDFYSGDKKFKDLSYYHFNLEDERFPFEDAEFDLVLFCEILEHLYIDPLAVLKEIKRVLKPMGTLVVTTPNANRIENIAKMIVGVNIYDPYSGYYGLYGRHNREYNVTELLRLLDHAGYATNEVFTADIGDNDKAKYIDTNKLSPLLSERLLDLGQYIFASFKNIGESQRKRPSFLFMNYPSQELDGLEAEVLIDNDIVKDRSVFLLKSWYSREIWSGKPTRWIGDEAVMLKPSKTNHISKMSLKASSFYQPRTIEITVEGVSLLKVLLPVSFTNICVQLPLKAGINTIMFRALEGGERPCDIHELESEDSRCLSFALQDICFD